MCVCVVGAAVREKGAGGERRVGRAGAGNQMEDVQKRAVAPKKIDGRGLLSSSSHCKEPLGAFEGEHASQYF